jgi:hypothetical protein
LIGWSKKNFPIEIEAIPAACLMVHSTSPLVRPQRSCPIDEIPTKIPAARVQRQCSIGPANLRENTRDKPHSGTRIRFNVASFINPPAVSITALIVRAICRVCTFAWPMPHWVAIAVESRCSSDVKDIVRPDAWRIRATGTMTLRGMVILINTRILVAVYQAIKRRHDCGANLAECSTSSICADG